MTYAPVNSSCAQLHPPPPRAHPRALVYFWPWMAISRGWGLLSCQMPRGGDEKGGQMRCPPSTLQQAQSNSAVLRILIWNFWFQLTSSFVTVLGLSLRLHAATTCTSLYFSIDVKLLTLKLI